MKSQLDNWIEWNGGPCPVAPNARVEVRFRNHECLGGDWTSLGSTWTWRHDGTNADIVAYRPVADNDDAPFPYTRLAAAVAAFGKELKTAASDDRAERAIAILERRDTAAPQFDAMVPAQEALAIRISAEICAGARPDAVRVLEWADALYKAEVGNDNGPVSGVGERPGDYLVADWAGPAYTNPPVANDRYPAPVKAELVTVWQRQGGSVLSVTAGGKVMDYAIPSHLLGSVARAFIGALEDRAA